MRFTHAQRRRQNWINTETLCGDRCLPQQSLWTRARRIWAARGTTRPIHGSGNCESAWKIGARLSPLREQRAPDCAGRARAVAPRAGTRPGKRMGQEKYCPLRMQARQTGFSPEVTLAGMLIPKRIWHRETLWVRPQPQPRHITTLSTAPSPCLVRQPR